MATLIYMMNISLDGYTRDEQGSFSWGAPREQELQQWLYAYVSSFSTLLYGRRMYETMLYWETAHTLPDQEPHEIDFARAWQAAEKIVFSRTLTEPASARTTIHHDLNPEVLRQLKAQKQGVIAISGPQLAAQALQAGLVDELQMRICPVVVGGGTRYLPGNLRLNLGLLDEKHFHCGDIFLRYAIRDVLQ